MSKGILYASPRTAQRHEKADYARAVELFNSRGYYGGDPVLVAYVVTYCFDKEIPFKWNLVEDSSPGVSTVTRVM